MTAKREVRVIDLARMNPGDVQLRIVPIPKPNVAQRKEVLFSRVAHVSTFVIYFSLRM